MSIASDASGNYYVSGAFEGTVDFGAGPLTSAGGSDVFVLKLDPSGSVIWSRRFGAEYDDESATVALDEGGNIFLVGSYNAGPAHASVPGPDFGGGPLLPTERAALFAAKLDPEGNHIRSRGIQDPAGGREIKRAAVDGDGNGYALFAAGDVFLSRLIAGTPMWTTWAAPRSIDIAGADLAIDSAGNAVVVCAIDSTDFSPPYHLSVFKVDPDGFELWQRSLVQNSPDESAEKSVSSVAVNAADEIFVTGFTDGTLDFGGGVLPRGPMLVKLDPEGQHLFSRPVRSGGKIALDPSGGMVIAGGDLAGLDASGTETWSSDVDAIFEDIAVAPNGTIAATGRVLAPVNFGTGPIAYAAGSDIFVATFNPFDDGGEGGGGGGGEGGGGEGGGTPGTCVPGTVLTCYTGPTGTVGIGPCTTGTQTCRSDGLGYGPCTGAVAPAAEICASPADEDCDGDPQCRRLAPWARAYGFPGDVYARSIVSDAWGNYYVSGDFAGTVDFGAGPLTSAGGSDVFLLKLDPSGSVIWSRRFGSEYDDRYATLAVDGSGNIYFAGLYDGHPVYLSSPDFGGGPIRPAEYSDALFLVKLDAEGNHIWSNGLQMEREFAGVGEIAIDGVGDVFVLYMYAQGCAVAKVSAGGADIVETYGVPGCDDGSADIAVDSDGNLLVASDERAAFDRLTTAFNVTKFSPTGATLWWRQFPSKDLENPIAAAFSVAVNAAGEVLVMAGVDGTVDFGGGALGSGDELFSVLVKLDAAGDVISTRTTPHPGQITLDPAGGMFVTFGSAVAKLDDSGSTLWSGNFPIPTGYRGGAADMVVSPSGTIAIAGTTYPSMDTGPGPSTARRGVLVSTLNP
ncbi:hypothetical protein BE18_32995 [Sorangium cellulosum]|uniref:Pyrrolo-quinoline quinone repeat domain-containing protein n=1 Tax=Sorangium cellulosum TaxID=56 RepID=A0A150R604_SORCE|nr:hypothetical protein BE18_32995 [Sorangium cellulosum]